MAKITLSSGVLRKGVRSTRAAAVLGQRASLFGVGRRGRAELAALNLKPASTGEDQMTANELKLYHAAASPNSRRVRIFLAEKGLAVPLVPVDLGKGEQHGEAYRAINPRRVVPTLVLEDGTAIGEVLAIWRYLEEAYPTPPLLGSYAERQGAGHHVGTARRARGFCRRRGGRSQRFGTTERPRDCWTLRL